MSRRVKGTISRRQQRSRRRTVRATRSWVAALARGEEQARLVLTRRAARAAAARRAALPSGGLVLAEGDSWFDYPFSDVLNELEDRFNYTVESVAHKGDTVEEMAYDPIQLEKLARKLQKLASGETPPKAILLSGGGNDIAGEEFAVLLHQRSTLPALSDQVVAGVFDQRLRAAIITLASAVTGLCRDTLGSPVPILIHGYDYPVPDGRGYLGGYWILPGPWLAPGFRRKGYDDTQLPQCCDVMVTLIDRFNRLLGEIAGGPGLEHVHHLDLRRTLSNDLRHDTYKKWWGNELHPTEDGFKRIAERFHQALAAL